MNEPHKLVTVEEIIKGQYTELRVSNGTEPKLLATTILRTFDENKRVAISCIGAQAVAQAFKAVAVANGEAVAQGVLLSIVPTFDVKKLRDRDTNQPIELTAIRMIIARIPLVL